MDFAPQWFGLFCVLMGPYTIQHQACTLLSHDLIAADMPADVLFVGLHILFWSEHQLIFGFPNSVPACLGNIFICSLSSLQPSL